ncbi:EboA domain-containing protein [Salmonirosea aquatica]|uniref:EboA domain-containing protein n=1 Tax=Salmonirosea aquatica TaxID=2654236 RepID=A0A7C9F784_9BACT|nr:hypothetical protein [Cytophagaceae bacterium SJW1-29]
MASNHINSILSSILQELLTQTEWMWLEEKGGAEPLQLMTAFVATPRFVGRRSVTISQENTIALNDEVPGFTVTDWSTVRLSRVWLLTCLDSSDQETYVRHIETLFDTAEMNELVALYSALPLLDYPQKWLFRATEAVRSNVGDVFDALVMHNPYPAHYFTEAAWNQLVLKTIFNDKPIHKIVGLEERANPTLAHMLSDFAHERWAAGRSVAPEVWRLSSGFMDNALLEDMKHLLASEDPNDHKAAALACFHATSSAAHTLLAQHPVLEKAVQHRTISWADLEFNDLNTYATKP